jgi:parallel beta-helix repeat protein
MTRFAPRLSLVACFCLAWPVIAADKPLVVELWPGKVPDEAARNFKYEIFRPDTRILRCDDRYPQKVEVVDARHLRIHNRGGRAADPEQVGDLIVIGAEYAPHGSAAHAVVCDDCAHVRLENITLFASNCFDFLENNCDGSTYDRCRIDRRPPDSDFVKRADPRLRSLDADAFHSKHAIRGPSYLQCTARFMGDDCINICGDYHLVVGSQGRELRVLAKHSMNIQPGDPVELVTYEGRRLPDARAVSIQPAGSIRDAERAFLLRQRMNESLRTAKGALTRAFTITLDREVNIPMGGVICSANRIGNGFAVKGCTFGFNRSRGILITASHGEVSGNRMEGCEMSAILVAPEYWWLEAGSSSDLRITGNTITACRGIPICIEANAGNGDTAPAGAHSNISITGNVVSNCPARGILVTSTRGLRMENNTLELTDTRQSIPGVMRKAGLKELKPVVEINCER